MADESGALVEHYAYDAWGRTACLAPDGTERPRSQYANRLAFQAREHSWSTTLTHFRARWYDPHTTRWLSNDPIGIAGGLNQYVAFGNHPVVSTDPFGLRDRTGDIVVPYLNRPNMTVAEKTANIIADIYDDAVRSHGPGFWHDRNVINQIQDDVGDTFVDGTRFGPLNGPTTFGTLSSDGALGGFCANFGANEPDFGRHLGGAFRYGQLTARAYEEGDQLQGRLAGLQGNTARQLESESETRMNRVFRRLLGDVADMVRNGATRQQVYDLALDAFTTN